MREPSRGHHHSSRFHPGQSHLRAPRSVAASCFTNAKRAPRNGSRSSAQPSHPRRFAHFDHGEFAVRSRHNARRSCVRADRARDNFHVPPSASQITSAVPSPPSAIGTSSMIASGKTSRRPAAMFFDTSVAPNEPLNLSGATKSASGIFVASATTLQLRSRISPAIAGFALPWESFITWPFRKLSDAALPA